MNAKYKNLYQELVSRDLTVLDEESFYNEYSTNDEKFGELHSYLESEGLTSLDPQTFKSEYLTDTPVEKKNPDVTELPSEDGLSGRLTDQTTEPDSYKKNTKDGVTTEVSINKKNKTIKVTNPKINKIFVKVLDLDGNIVDEKTIDIPEKSKPEIYTNFPGKGNKEYEFKVSDGVAHWYEANPKKSKALTELNAAKNATRPGLMGHGTLPVYSPEEIKKKEAEYKKIAEKIIIEDDARVRALNNQFKKNASLDPIDQVYTNYDEEKKDNEYRINDDNWQRKVPGATSWTTVTDEGAISGLNRRYSKEVKYKPELKFVKQEPKLEFAGINTSLVSKTEEDAVTILSKNYGKYGFTFEQSGYGTDYIVAYNKDKTKEITVGFDEANPEEALKLKNFLEQNASKEKSNAALELEKKIKSLNSTHTSPSAKGYDILDRTNTLKYVLSDEYKTKFSSLSFDEMEDQINNYIKTSFQKSEDLDKFWGSDAYKIFKEKKKEEFGARDEKIDLLYTELQSAKLPADIKKIKSKISAYLTEDVIQDQVKNYSMQLNDLDKSAKILASDQKKYLQSVDDFNKLSQSGQMTQEEFDLAKKNLEDQAEKLGTRADFLMSSGKSIQNDQKKLNVVAGKYFTKKEKAGSFGGGIVNSILTGISKSIIEVPSTFVISLTESSGSEYFKLSPEEKQYYKDKGYSKDQTINLLLNNKIKDFKAETRKNLIDVLGADQTTQEYMKSSDRGLFAKSIFGVAESAPAMLMGFGGYAASFTGLASQAYSSIEDEMLNDADFETSSVGERAVVAVPYAVLMGVLENFGLKNVVKGSSFTGGIVKDILINSMKQMPKDGTKGLLQNIMTKEVKSVLAKGAFKIVNGAIAEFETGATQALVLDIGLKALYNKISQSGMTEEQISNLSGGEMFATPDTLGELTSTVLEDGFAEAIGGATMSTFTTVATGLKNGNISLYNEDDLNYLKEISQDSEFKKIIVANLKTEMLKGNLTKSEAQERLDAMNELSSVIQSIPDGLSNKDQISAVNTLSEKNRLTKEIQGKDPALVTAQTDRINEINEELKNISKNATKEDNIEQQEGTAEGGISEYQGTGEGQQEVGVSQGGQRETTINEADSSDSTIPSKVQQEEQVATLRAEEQAELLEAIPKIESYKVNGEIDKTLMPKTVLAKYNSIYDKYDNLISPLLETTGEVAIDKPIITTNTTAEVSRVKSLTPESEDGATFNIDGTKYEGVGLVVPVDSMNTTTEELTPEMVADFVAERQKMIGDAGVVKAGIYKFPNSNQVSIDLSVVVPETSREQALEFARLAGQESLFDLATFENIKTGATGENPMSFSPEQHREISKALKEGRMPNVFGTTAEITNNLLTKENIKKVEIKQTTPKNKLIVKAAKMVLNAIPGVKIYMHNNGQEMASAIEASKKQLTKEEKTGLTESSGLYVDGDIHINLESATIGTVYHEAFHALIEKNGMKSGSILLMAKGLKNIISDKGVKQRLDDFVSQYNEDEKAEEYISELGGILSEAEQELTTTKLQQFKTLINNIAKKLGLPVIFSASATAQDAADFINTMSKKLRTGEEIDINDPGDGGEVGTFNIPKVKFRKAKSVSEDSRDFIREFVEDLDIRELNGEKFITNMYDFTNAGKTDLGNGFEINMLGGKNYVPLMMSLNNKKIGEVSNLAAFNTKAQAETFVRNAEMSGAKIFAPHSGTLSNSWQFQQHTFAELSSLVLDNEILTKDKLIDVFNDAIKTNKSNQKEFNQFAKKYEEDIKNFDSFKSDPKKIIELLDIKNNYSPNLRKALNNAISANKEFQKAIGIKNKQEFYNRIMDPLNQGMTGGEIMNIVKFDPNTFEIVQTKESDIDNHPSFGWTLLAKINGIYQPTELYKSSDITETYTKYNKGGEEVSRKAEEPKFEQKNVSSSAGAIPKVAEFKESSKIKFQKSSGVGYRSGDLTNKAETKGKFEGGDRSTGHFGTGFYFFGTKKKADEYSNRETNSIDLNGYNLANGTIKLHNLLKDVNKYAIGTQKENDSLKYSIENIIRYFNKNISINNIKDLNDQNNKIKSIIDKINNNNIDSPSTVVMKALGFDGVDSRGTDLDNAQYGSVLYSLKKPEEGAPSKIKFQKTTQETRMDSEAEAIFKKSLDRGVAWNTAIQNVIDYIQISKWYEEASDIDREQKIRDFRQSKKQKLKKAPSVAKIMGTPKPSTVTVTEKTALKDQIKLEARAAREAKVDLNEKRKLLSTAIKGLVKLGKLNTRQAGIIIERVGYVNLDNQVMVDRLAEYAAKVFEKANYKDRLSRAFSFRKGIRKLLKGDIQAEVVGMAKKFSKIDPSMVDDIEKYLEMAEIVKNAIKPSRVNRKDLDVSMRESMNIDSVSEFTNDAIENQEAILKEELLAVHSELVDAGVIDDKMSLSEIELTINSLKEKEDNANYKADILTFLSRRIDTMSAIIKDILTYKINPMTGEDVALTEKNIDLISRMLNIDINNVSIKEAIFIAEAMDNFINNNITSSVEAVIEKHEGATELENLIADKVVASPLRKYFSTYAGQLFSEQVASMPILFEKLFVGAKKGLMVAKKMGWTALINGVNKAEKMFNTTVDSYFKQYSKTKPNGKSFNDAENVYERGMLAFLSRNVSGTVTQQAEEFKRRVEVLKESVKSLLEGSTKEQKMGELYQKIYDKLNVESGDIDVIHANADKINRSAVSWWINQWGTTYSDLSDISLSVYNTVLSSDTSYSTDRYKLLGKSTSEEIIDPKTGSFGRDIEFLDKNKAGVMMPSTKPSASAVSNASRYISLDFDVNNTSAYKGALIDINTAAAIRKIDGFINSDNLAKLIPTEDDRKIFTGRIKDYIQAAKNKMPLQSDKMRLLDQLTNFLGGIGVAKALGGIDQVVKQTLPIALSTFVNSGRFDLVMPGSSASVWIDSLGMAISNRGQESQSTIESVDRRLEKASGLIDKSTNAFVDVQQFWLKYFLSKPDVFIAKSSFISYYKQYLSNNNQSTDIDWATHNVNQDAADYAMLMVDRQQNVSDAKMAGKIFSSQDSTKKIMRKIFLPFASFSLNQKSRMVSDIKVLGINSGASKQDKMIALRSLASLPFEMALYQSMSLAIRLGYLAIAKGIIGAVADDDDEEKEKLLGMEMSKEMKNATKYPLRSLITDFLSPAPVLDNLVVGGANALLRQSEDKEMIDDAVDKKNLMLKISGKEKMDDDEKEKFIKKFKKDHEYQLFNDEQKSWGTIGIGIDLYTEIMDNAKTAYTGKYTQDYMGNESERFLLPKDQDNIKNAVIFETLFALGIVPRDVNTVTKNIIKLSKKNSLTETQYEKYKAVGKETGGKVTGWKMDLTKSKSKLETTVSEIEWIEKHGGLNEEQGKEYVKLSSAFDEVSYRDLQRIQSGKTADQIINSYSKK